jgi:hypothetical protein
MIKKLSFNFDLSDNKEKEIYELLLSMNLYKRTYYITDLVSKLEDNNKFTRLEKKLFSIIEGNKKIVYKEKPEIKEITKEVIKEKVIPEVKKEEIVFKPILKEIKKDKNVASVLDEKLDSITDEGFK